MRTHVRTLLAASGKQQHEKESKPAIHRIGLNY
jgi:hypothetical protein